MRFAISAALAWGMFLNVQAIAFADTIHVPADQPTIQAGIDAAVNGDVVLVSPGFYWAPISINGKAIEVRSTHGARRTSIYGGQTTDSVVRITNAGPQTVLEGFAIWRGLSDPGDGGGGGGLLVDTADPSIINCRFVSNRATGKFSSHLGGGAAVWNSFNTRFINCEFVGNSADAGGAIACVQSVTTLINCTITGNEALDGGAIFALRADVHAYNCVLWNNAGGSDGSDSCCVVFDHCDVQTAGPGAVPGAMNINADPLIVRTPLPGFDGVWGTDDDQHGDMRIRPNSPCLDAGENAALPSGITVDVAGRPRIVNGVVDMGAHEGPACLADLFPDGGNNKVDIDDLIHVIRLWGAVGPPNTISADISNDGVVNIDDLLSVVHNWGPCE